MTVGTPALFDVTLGPNPSQCHLYHIRRTGAHGVIDWMLAHHDGPKIHYNQAMPLGAGKLGVRLEQVQEIPGDPGKPLFPLVSLEDQPLNRIVATVQLPRQVVILLRDPFNTFASRLAIVRKFEALPRRAGRKASPRRGLGRTTRRVPLPRSRNGPSG